MKLIINNNKNSNLGTLAFITLVRIVDKWERNYQLDKDNIN